MTTFLHIIVLFVLISEREGICFSGTNFILKYSGYFLNLIVNIVTLETSRRLLIAEGHDPIQVSLDRSFGTKGENVLIFFGKHFRFLL
jgi:hypothetical protein